MKFKPASALEAQHELFAFTQSREGLKYLQAFLSITEMEAGRLQRQQALTLRTSPTYFVTSDMLSLAKHAAESMPSLPLSIDDFISPSGVCIFEEAIILRDLHNKDTALVGFMWQPGRHQRGEDGIVWSFLSDTEDTRDFYLGQHDDILQAMPRLLPLQIRFEEFGVEAATAAEAARESGGDLAMAAESILLLRNMPLCLFTLMGQTLATTTTEKPQRQTRRRLARKKSPLADKLVNVVRLRRLRAKKETGESKTVEWTHRWIVNGHWRMQPTNAGPKRIWIMPFVKGDEDLPLKLKETVYVLER